MTKNTTKPKNTIFVELTSYGSLNIVSAPLKLHKDSFRNVNIKCAVPITAQTSSNHLCKVFALTIDSSGQIKSSKAYNLPKEINNTLKAGQEYIIFSAPLPKEFCAINGDLQLTFNYFDTDGTIDEKTKTSNATSIIASGPLTLQVDGAGADMDGVVISNYDTTAALANKNSTMLYNDTLLLADVTKFTHDDNGVEDEEKKPVPLPDYVAAYSDNGYKSSNVKYINVSMQIPKDDEVAIKTGELTAYSKVENAATYQVEFFSCELGLFTRMLKGNGDSTLTMSLDGKYTPTDWQPTNNDYWQKQIESLKTSDNAHVKCIRTLKTTSEDHESQITKNTTAIADLTAKENNRDHFKGMFSSPEDLPSIDESNPTGATDNDYAYVISTKTIWQVTANQQTENTPKTHDWKDTLEPYPSDTTLIDTATPPTMNGEASAGKGVKVSASDHVHPTDTTRADADALKATDAQVETLEKYTINNDTKITEIKTKNTEQDSTLKLHGNRLDGLKSRVDTVEQDINGIDGIKAKDAEQDTALITHTDQLSGLDNRLTTAEQAIITNLSSLTDKDNTQDLEIATLSSDKLNKSDIDLSLQKASDESSYTVTDTGAIIETQVSYNPATKAETTSEHMVVPVTNAAARLILVQEQEALQQLVSWKDSMEGDPINYPVDLSGVPSDIPTSDISVQSFLNELYISASGKETQPFDQTQLIDDTTGVVYRFYTIKTQWYLSKGSPSAIATQESVGVGKGSTQKYYNFYEVDGTSTPNGLDELDIKVHNNTSNITAETVRAKAAEQANSAAIATEETTRIAAVNELQRQVTENTNTIPNKADKTVTVAGKSLESNITLDTLTIQKNGAEQGVYNGEGSKTVNIVVPTKTSEITNDGNGSNAYATVNQIPTNYISTVGGQTINGVLSVAEPVSGENVATKAYADTKAGLGSDNTFSGSNNFMNVTIGSTVPGPEMLKCYPTAMFCKNIEMVGGNINTNGRNISMGDAGDIYMGGGDIHMAGGTLIGGEISTSDVRTIEFMVGNTTEIDYTPSHMYGPADLSIAALDVIGTVKAEQFLVSSARMDGGLSIAVPPTTEPIRISGGTYISLMDSPITRSLMLGTYNAPEQSLPCFGLKLASQTGPRRVVSGLTAPIDNDDAANKAYVDSKASLTDTNIFGPYGMGEEMLILGDFGDSSSYGIKFNNMSKSPTIRGLADPRYSSDAANKAYVDSKTSTVIKTYSENMRTENNVNIPRGEMREVARMVVPSMITQSYINTYFSSKTITPTMTYLPMFTVVSIGSDVGISLTLLNCTTSTMTIYSGHLWGVTVLYT